MQKLASLGVVFLFVMGWFVLTKPDLRRGICDSTGLLCVDPPQAALPREPTRAEIEEEMRRRGMQIPGRTY